MFLQFSGLSNLLFLVEKKNILVIFREVTCHLDQTETAFFINKVQVDFPKWISLCSLFNKGLSVYLS